MHNPTNLTTSNNYSSILLAFFLLSLLCLFLLFFLLLLPRFLSLPHEESKSQKQQHCHTETCPYQGRVGNKVVHAQLHQVITREGHSKLANMGPGVVHVLSLQRCKPSINANIPSM